VNFESVRENILIGYGLVVGLQNTGNTSSSSHFMLESLVSMLEHLGVNNRDKMRYLKTKNVVPVMITTKLPPRRALLSRVDTFVLVLSLLLNTIY
jgi:flagellar P-ring protein precursor FlgI